MIFGQKDKKDKQILINAMNLETRVAVLHEGRLDEFEIERSSQDRIVGSIFKGRIQNLEDGLQAAFVDIGLRKNAFIHYWDMIPEDTVRLEAEEGISPSRRSRKKRYPPGEMAKKFPIGSEIVVQVTKDAIGTKGPRVTANLSMPGRFLVMMPGSNIKGVSRKIDDGKERARLKKILARLPIPEGIGLIVRTVGAGTRKVSFARDLRALLDNWEDVEHGIKELPAPCRLYDEPDLAERIVRDALTEDVDSIIIDSREIYERTKALVSKISRRNRGRLKLYDGDRPIFDYYDIERQLETIFLRKVPLPSGGCLVFDETEALVAVDVNTGKHKGKNTQEESILEVNLEAAEEVARQLRLRNIGGLIVIDFIDMKAKRDQNSVSRKLKEALRPDKARTNVLAISPLGLCEMTRQREAESIRASTYMDCPYCNGRGKIKSGLSMSVEIQRHLAEIMRRNRKAKEGMNIKIIVNPSILERLRSEDEEALMDMEEKFHGRLTFVSDSSKHLEEFTMEDKDTGDMLYELRHQWGGHKERR